MYLGGIRRWVPQLFAFIYSLPLVLVIPIRAKLQGPVVRKAINLGLNFNPVFFLFKSIFQDNFLNSF